jgi:L-alanine-DL-glutamate epimerase-like enolase superfamily enzyme
MCCGPLAALSARGVRLIFQPDEGQAVGIELVARIAGARDRFTIRVRTHCERYHAGATGEVPYIASAAGVISATAGWAIGRSDADDRRKVTAHRLDRGLNRCDGKGDHSHAAVSARDFAMKA